MIFKEDIDFKGDCHMSNLKERSNGETPVLYRQPFNDFSGRTVVNNIENVNYIKKSKMRFWYNNQTEAYGTHWHNAMEIIIPIEETYNVIINEKSFSIKENEILFIPCGATHSICAHEFGSRFIYLIDISLFYNLSDFQILSPLFVQPSLFSKDSHPYIYGTIYSIFMEMNEIYFSGDMFWEFSIYSLLMQIFTAIGTNQFKKITTNIQPSKKTKYYEKFSDLLYYIDTHYNENLTLEAMADLAGFSKYYFSRLFKQYTNYTFYNYLCYKRIQASQALLSTNISVTEIAFQTGFNNLSTFCRTFKKYVNCSPTEYRNTCLSSH